MRYSFIIPASAFTVENSFDDNCKNSEVTLYMYVAPWDGFSGKVTNVDACSLTKKKQVVQQVVQEESKPDYSKERSCW